MYVFIVGKLGKYGVLAKLDKIGKVYWKCRVFKGKREWKKGSYC
jgi:hypothetical protein